MKIAILMGSDSPEREISMKTGKAIEKALLNKAFEITREAGASSLHFLFSRREENRAFEEAGFRIRNTFQYHWRNPDRRFSYHMPQMAVQTAAAKILQAHVTAFVLPGCLLWHHCTESRETGPAFIRKQPANAVGSRTTSTQHRTTGSSFHRGPNASRFLTRYAAGR